MLILNAGVLYGGLLENVKPKDMQATLDVNVYHPTAMLKVLIEKLLRREKDPVGIILVSSI